MITVLARSWRVVGAASVVATLTALTGGVTPRAARAQADAALRAPDAFASIPDRAQRSIALFTEAGKVFQHPRCQNCHSGDDRPRQGEGRTHQPPVRGGKDGDGVPGLRCAACHGEANYDAVGMPGLADWHLAPPSMNLRAPLPTICAQLKDPDKNGSRSLEDLLKHVANDPLVAWAWAPGGGRRPAPGTHATFFALLRAWAATGAECPPAGSQSKAPANAWAANPSRLSSQSPALLHWSVYRAPDHFLDRPKVSEIEYPRARGEDSPRCYPDRACYVLRPTRP